MNAPPVDGPHPLCTLCSDAETCAFHAAKTPEDLARAFIVTLKGERLLGLATYFEAAFAGLTTLPPELARVVARMPTAPLEKKFAALLDLDNFDADSLFELATISLALATHIEIREKLSLSPATTHRRTEVK